MASSTTGNSFKYERLDKSKALLLIVDHQVGLFQLVRDMDAVTFRNNMLAHAELGKIFDLPVIMTTSAETGPNGPLPGELTNWYPDAPLIKRQGEVNAWDDPAFRAAVHATGRTQIILAGIVTDVCTCFLALSLREAGFSVWANHEASGTTSPSAAEAANDRMRASGVQVVSYFAVVGELMRDWRNQPGSGELIPKLDKYFPIYGMVARGHRAAIGEGEVLPGEDVLP